MSQRVAKVESVVRQVVAEKLVDVLERDSAKVTVTRVDVSPDLRHAIVWIGIIGPPEPVLARLKKSQREIQANVDATMTTKFVPRVEFQHDSGGIHAAEIERLLRQL